MRMNAESSVLREMRTPTATGVALWHEGQPLPDQALRLFSRNADEQVVRTDAQGRARFVLGQNGQHLIATTHLRAPASPDRPWTSRWATLGFNVAE